MAAKPAKKPVAAKPPKAAKAKTPTRAQLQQEVATLQKDVRQLQSAAKHSPKKTGKHPAGKTPAKKAGSAKHGTKRGLALPDGVACCAAEGLAASLRLAGKPVGADDVLALYYATPGADETGAPILATLKAAQTYGLAGAYPVFKPASAPVDGVVAGITLPHGPHTVTLERGGVWTWGEWRPASRTFTSGIEEAWVIAWLLPPRATAPVTM